MMRGAEMGEQAAAAGVDEVIDLVEVACVIGIGHIGGKPAGANSSSRCAHLSMLAGSNLRTSARFSPSIAIK